MSDQTERAAELRAERWRIKFGQAHRSSEWERARADVAEARVRELEAALQQSRDDHQGAVEKLRAVEALADRWAKYDEPAWVCASDRICAALASPVESGADAEDAK